MAEIIRMPRLSDTMTEGVIVVWHKKVGDAIEIGDILADVETDKATMELEAYNDGVLLHIGVEEGQTVAIDTLIAVLGEKDDDIKVILDDITDSDKYELTIDIQSQTINTPNDKVYSFDINPSDKERIILGYDDIGLTLKHSDKIKEYETKMKIKKPWIFEDNHE